jgi:hypothetical protein
MSKQRSRYLNFNIRAPLVALTLAYKEFEGIAHRL